MRMLPALGIMGKPDHGTAGLGHVPAACVVPVSAGWAPLPWRTWMLARRDQFLVPCWLHGVWRDKPLQSNPKCCGCSLLWLVPDIGPSAPRNLPLPVQMLRATSNA